MVKTPNRFANVEYLKQIMKVKSFKYISSIRDIICENLR